MDVKLPDGRVIKVRYSLGGPTHVYITGSEGWPTTTVDLEDDELGLLIGALSLYFVPKCKEVAGFHGTNGEPIKCEAKPGHESLHYVNMKDGTLVQWNGPR